jgi:hypothetical protein
MNDGAQSSISSVSDKECLTTTSTATQQYGLDRDSNRGKILDEEQMVESGTEAKSFLLGSQYVDLNSETATSLFTLLLQFKSIT